MKSAIVQDQLAQARRHRLERSGLLSPLIAEIAEALVALGGAASLTSIADLVARRRGGLAASEGLKSELGLAFQLHCERAALEGRKAAFVAGPPVWSLTPDAYAFLSLHMKPASLG